MICGVIFLEKEVVNMKKIYMPDGGKILKQEESEEKHHTHLTVKSQNSNIDKSKVEQNQPRNTQPESVSYSCLDTVLESVQYESQSEDITSDRHAKCKY